MNLERNKYNPHISELFFLKKDHISELRKKLTKGKKWIYCLNF